MLGRYISAARRIEQAPARARRQRRPRPRTVMDREQSRRIRSWAMERGLLAAPRGRIPQHVADEYQAAMRVSPVPFRSSGGPGPQPASRGSRTKSASRRRAPRGAEGDKAAAQAHGGPKARVTVADSSGLTEREQQELRSIADTAKPAHPARVDPWAVAGDTSHIARDAQPNSGHKRPPQVDWTAGMPLGHENTYTPMGEIEQFTKFASGVKRATSWRGIVGRLLALVILLPVIAAIILFIAHHV